MNAAASINSKVRDYLAEMPPQHRLTLFRAIEKARLVGAADHVQMFLLDELRVVLNSLGEDAPRALSASRIFFNAVEHYLVDERPSVKIPGRISRGTLQSIWTWIERDVATDDVKSYTAALVEEYVSKGSSENTLSENEMAGFFRQSVMRLVVQARDEAQQSPEKRRRLAAQIGDERCVQELEDVIEIMQNAQALENLRRSLPAKIDPSNPDDVGVVAATIVRAGSIGTGFAGHACILIRERMDSAAKLPRLAALAVGTPDLKIVMGSPFGALVELALSDADIAVQRVLSSFDLMEKQQQGPAALKEYHLLSRNLRATFDLDNVPCDWSRRLAELRMKISQRLERELGDLLPTLRRSVRTMRSFANRPLVKPDIIDVERSRMLIEIFDVSRLAVSELALNELVQRVRSEVESYFQAATQALIDEVRSSSGDRLVICQAYATAAVKLAESLYGQAHAAVLRKSFDVASGVTGGGRSLA